MKQQVNHIDHVIWVCRPENLEGYVDTLSKLCDVRFHGPVEKTDMGLRLYMSWAAGLEVVAPVAPDNANADALRTHLERRGEGLLGVVFGVPDIEAARRRAEGLGYPVSGLIGNLGTEPYVHETEVMKEVVAGDFMNAMFVFGEIRYADDLLR